MIALYIILGIVLLIVVAFSLNVGVIADYGEKTVVKVKYLFAEFIVYDSSKPPKEKKPKKEKPEKEKTKDEPAVEEQPADEKNAENKPKQKGNNLFKQIYLDHGYDGIVKMLGATRDSLGGFFGKLYKTLTIDELYITMITAGSDAADTAIKHGKLCAWVYPILGKLVSTCKVKKYDFSFSPDFLAKKNEAKAYIRLHITPIRITNGAVVLALQLVFKVLFKILFSNNKVKKLNKATVMSAAQEVIEDSAVDNTNNENLNKDGASL